MAEKLKNIIEDIASDYLDIVLALKYDICTCEMCKNDMLAHVLSIVPAKYVTTEEAMLREMIEQTKAEHQAIIARAIIEAVEVISKKPRHEVKEDKEKAFNWLLEKIFLDRGLDFRRYRKELLKRRIALRMRTNKLRSYSEYLRLLINRPQEYDKLFDVLTINVTEFFRDPEVWNSIVVLCRELIKNKSDKKQYLIRAWSAGSSSGAEAYSFAILLKELLTNKKEFSIKIIGTDIDLKSLRAADNGEYGKDTLKNINPEYLKKYFIPLMNGRYRVKDSVKELVEFRRLDLINEPHIEKIDLVFCRNVFIYFARSLQEMLLMKFYKALLTGGYLVMGKVETILGEAKQIFDVVHHEAKIYRKK